MEDAELRPIEEPSIGESDIVVIRILRSASEILPGEAEIVTRL